MKFWEFDLLPSSFNDTFNTDSSTGRAVSSPKKNNFKSELSPTQLWEEKLALDLRPLIEKRAVFSLGADTPTYRHCRRYSANMGGFFSYPSESNKEGQEVFVNGFGIYSIIGRRGWAFVTRNEFPLHPEILSANARNTFKISRGEDLLNFFGKITMFEKNGPLDRFLQNYNFARTYRSSFSKHFLYPSTRGEEGFRMFYNQQPMDSKIVANYSMPNMPASRFFTFCTKNFELTSMFRGACGGNSGAAAVDKDNFVLLSYEKFCLNLNSQLIDSLTDDYQDHFDGNYFVKLNSGGGFIYSTCSPFWLRNKAIERYREKFYFNERLNYNFRGRAALNIRRESRSVCGIRAYRSSRQMLITTLVVHYAAVDHLLESKFTLDFINKKSAIELSWNRGKSQFQKTFLIQERRRRRFIPDWKVKKRRSFAEQGNRGPSDRRLMRLITATPFHNAARDFVDSKLGPALIWRRNLRLRGDIRRRQRRRVSRTKLLVLPKRRLKSPYRRRG